MLQHTKNLFWVCNKKYIKHKVIKSLPIKISEIKVSQHIMNLKNQDVISRITFQSFCDPFTIKCSFGIAKFSQISYYFLTQWCPDGGDITFEYCSQNVLYVTNSYIIQKQMIKGWKSPSVMKQFPQENA